MPGKFCVLLVEGRPIEKKRSASPFRGERTPSILRKLRSMPFVRWLIVVILILGGFLAGKAFRAPEAEATKSAEQINKKVVEVLSDAVIPEVSVEQVESPDRRTGAIPVSSGAPDMIRTRTHREIADLETPRTLQPIPESPPPPLSAYESRETITPPIRRPDPVIQEPPTVREKLHRINDGDTLESLALRYYGNAEAADRIWNENRNLIVDRSLLPVGRTLRIRIETP